MTDFASQITGVRSPSLREMGAQTMSAFWHIVRIVVHLKMCEQDKGFKIVLADGTELKISNGWNMSGGLLQFSHSSGPKTISFARIKRVESNE